MKHIQYPDLEPLMRPKSVALIGASGDPATPGGLALNYLLKYGYKGKIFPINPKYDQVQNLKCYPSITDIPDDIDVAMIIMAAARVIDAVKQCAEKGVKAAIIPVIGFAESDEEGKKRQAEIDEILKKSALRICGPNTNGIRNMHNGIALGYSFAQDVALPGKVGYVSQSGALLSATIPRAAQRGIGFSYFVGAGNQADLETTDYLRFMLDDPNTEVLMAFIEGIKGAEKFSDFVDLALDRGKPLVILKLGRSELSAKTAMGHSASLVGSDQVFDAICKQKGVARVDDFDQLIATALVFLKCKLPKGNRIGVISTSGGSMGLIADNAQKLNLSFPPLSPKTVEEASKILPTGEIKNPFDMVATFATARARELAIKTMQLFVDDENLDIILAVVTPMDKLNTENFIAAVIEVAKNSEKPVILFAPMTFLREGEAELFAQGDVPMVLDGAEAVNAINALIKFSQTLKRHREEKEQPPVVSVDVEAVKRLLKASGKTLTEHESKSILAQYGIPVTEEDVAKSAEEAVQIANKVGYPVVLKIDSPQIAHKTDAGAIKVNIRNETELVSAYHEVIANSKKFDPKAEIRGVLVQEMVEDGREVIVGMSHDQQFGPTLVFGLGGVFVEVLKDTSLRLAPITRHDAEEMISEIKGAKILEAFRGKPKADVAAIVDVLLKMSKLSADLGEFISEIDINPLMVLDEGKGVKAVDALIVRRD